MAYSFSQLRLCPEIARSSNMIARFTHEPGMNQTASNPLETLFARLRESLGELAPDPLLERMKPVLNGFFEQFQLVPRREYDAHLATLTRLEDTVSRLEERISELERGD